MSNQSALLVMDMQNGIVGSLSNSNEIIDKNKKAIESARKHQIPVIFVSCFFERIS